MPLSLHILSTPERDRRKELARRNKNIDHRGLLSLHVGSSKLLCCIVEFFQCRGGLQLLKFSFDISELFFDITTFEFFRHSFIFLQGEVSMLSTFSEVSAENWKVDC